MIGTLERIAKRREVVVFRIRELETEGKAVGLRGSSLSRLGGRGKGRRKSIVESACLSAEYRSRRIGELRDELELIDWQLAVIAERLFILCDEILYGFKSGVTVVFLRHVLGLSWEKIASRLSYPKYSCRKFYKEIVGALEGDHAQEAKT